MRTPQEYGVIKNLDVPEEVAENKIYIIGGRDNEWLIVFKCPCGCKDAIYLNMLKKARPQWRYKIGREGITLSPSINRRYGCKSHFRIINSIVDFC